MTTPGEGHNSIISTDGREKVRSYVRRALNLEGDMDDLKADLKELYKEAKGDGFDPAILRKVVARARKDPAKLAEEEALIETYEAAIQGDLFASEDTKVTIEFGDKKVETSPRKLQAAADKLPA